MIDNLNEIIKFKSATKVIELLLELQNSSDDLRDYKISELGKKMIQNEASN